ncbi:MAG TPA: alpha-2-macroglobulin family protein [Stellaceae bacterium]|nr:alpha-2-macroglobulin family protein [Stellaceae bacterium]
MEYGRNRLARLVLGVFIVLLGLLPALAEVPDTLKRPMGGVVVPERFLRRWDPVTIFFDGDVGPAAGGPEDHAERFVTMSPAHPGAFTWLNARTLQFRPAEPWPALAEFRWKLAAKEIRLITLLPPPSSSIPADGATGLGDVESLTLTMPEPVDPAVLAGMVTVDLQKLPGLAATPARTLGAGDFDVKAVERASRSDPATYVLRFKEPIGGGTRAVVHLRLSPEQALDGITQDIVFATAEPFHVASFGCPGGGVPAPPSGVTYPAASALRCRPGNNSVLVEFSAEARAIDAIAARNLVRITPVVDDLAYETSGAELRVSGKFVADTLYTVRLEPTAMADKDGRPLQMTGASEVSLFFPAVPDYLRWQQSQGIVERLGPQMAPLQGRGFDRVDLRIYPVDPLNRSFWPFPEQPVATNEMLAPPGPGEEPKPIADNQTIDQAGLVAELRNLGSPAISEIVATPLRKGGAAARFGLDLKPYLERIAGPGAPGTYLVGIRRLDGGAERSWMRIQVTDLSLTTVEEPDTVRFFVTSLATGAPVPDAEIRIEGVVDTHWVVHGQGPTGADGQFAWKVPGGRAPRGASLRRITVAKDGDTLVIDPAHPPPVNGAGNGEAERWLDWTLAPLGNRQEPPQLLCHIFTERPIYRPEEPVHVKAWVRSWQNGVFTPFTGKAQLVVSGAENIQWTDNLDMTPEGTAYYKFDEKTAATGEYEAHLMIAGDDCGSVEFKKEAYRLPKFEVELHAPQKTGLDSDFGVDLAARYYAGGSVAGRPVRWRVTQYSYDWAAEQRQGYVFSSDQRYSGLGEFRSTPVLEKDDKTDADGNAKLRLDPTIEPTAQPRRYVVEATVTGDDDQTVTTTHQVLALPAFVLGVKLPRFLEKAVSIEPEIIAEDPDGKLIVGQEITVRLLRRQWHSALQATDFSQGTAKYVTDVVDEKIAETKVTSDAAPKSLSFPIDRAGVYVVELEAQDRTGRAQKLAVDLFANGDQPLTWARQPAKKFAVTTDKARYAPGEVANLVLESPYQTGAALAVIEHASGKNDYRWVPVANGAGSLKLDIPRMDMPKLPVHFVLMRGRVADTDAKPGALVDLARPATVVNNTTLAITPEKHEVKVELTAPTEAQPGDEIELGVALRDDAGRPLSGEVTLWLVDQAVLSLAKEQPLDPIPDFIVDRDSKVVLRDTRNLALGLLPLQEIPGGDTGKQSKDLLDQVPIRKNFTPLPYYNPRLMIGPDGNATVKVKLPDSLTNFMIRAKAVSGADRFGFSTGKIMVRLPVIVEPALPRFVRPGDRFVAAAIGRIVEGDLGPGRAELRVDGLNLDGPAAQVFDWEKTPTRIEATVDVPSPAYAASGRPERDGVTLTFGVERSADKAHDAFAVTLPIRPDRDPVVKRELVDLAPGAPYTVPAITEAYRPGTLKRGLTIAAEPALLRLAASLDYLRDYPFGCTEQRVSAVRAEIAARQFHDLLLFERTADRTGADYKATVAWIKGAIDANGLVAYWPGTKGDVALTAWTLQFLTEAKAAGYEVEKPLADGITSALQQSLRSDYPYLLVGEDLAERTWALVALAQAGAADAGYAAELARHSQQMTLEGRAEVMRALTLSGQAPPAVLASLTKDLWPDVVFRLVNGKEAYGGLQADALRASPLLLPSEARSIAEVIRATSGIGPDQRRRLMVKALVASAGPQGWGSTNANAEAFLALSEYFATSSGGTARKATLARGSEQRALTLDAAEPIVRFNELHPDALVVTASAPGEPLGLLADTRYLATADGSNVAASAEGFVVNEAVQKLEAGQPVSLDQPAKRLEFAVGDVVEQQLELINPEERHQVAVVIPLAAGMEPLNPGLATAPPEAKPSHAPSLEPTYVAFLDDSVEYFYETLPKGTFDFAFRSRATVPGRFIQPAASAEMMYQEAVRGNGNGAEVVIERK